MWCCNCFYFFIFFILLHTYLYTFLSEHHQEFKCEFKYFLREENLDSLGLGRIKTTLLDMYRKDDEPPERNV